MTKKISVLIPSRGRPEEFGSCIENLFDLAEEPDDIEVIARLDKDDNHRRYPEYKNTLKIIGPRYSGYADNHKFIEEAAAVSTGDFIMQYVDTARMLNPFWDQAYLETIGQTKIFVATADVEDERGSSLYRWSFPFISRFLHDLCGMFCLGQNPSIDRCWAAFAQEMHCEIRVSTRILHQEKRNTKLEDLTAKETQPFYKELNKDWEKRRAEHKAIGKKFADIVKDRIK